MTDISIFVEDIIVGMFALAFGSFIAASFYRWQHQKHIWTFRARSACPVCNQPLKILDLLPVLSWLFLGGKCRYCGARISVMYPLIELGTLAICFFIYKMYV